MCVLCVCVVSGCLIMCWLECMCMCGCASISVCLHVCVDVIVLHVVVCLCVCWMLHTRMRLRVRRLDCVCCSLCVSECDIRMLCNGDATGMVCVSLVNV